MSHPHHPHKPGDKAGHRKLDDGAEDRLVPLKSIDPLEIRTFDEMLKAMSETAFSGRSLGEAADVLTAMTRDPDCLVVATFSGAMTVAKMGKVIVRMIEAGMIDCIVSTGALMAHGLSEAVGLTHYKVDPTVPDEVLFEKGYNRVYDTLELETNLNDIEVFVRKGPRHDADRSAVVERVDLPCAREGAREVATLRASCARRTSGTCPCTSRPSPTRSSGSTSPRG
jgi:deoxyhypusine synthase